MDGSDNVKPTQFPPLTIGDLLILTFTVSVSLACVTPAIHEFLALPEDQLRIPRWLGVVPELTDSTAFGISLFGSLILARQQLRGSNTPLAPGHWILIATAPYMLLLVVSGALHQCLPVSWWNAHLEVRNLQEVIFSIVVALSVSFGLPALRIQELRWRTCLALILSWLAIIVVWCAREGANIGGTFWLHILGGAATAYLAAFATACAAVAIDVV
jgi:hypothetical protein